MLNFIDNILKENRVLKNALEDAKHQIEELRFQCEQLRRHQFGSRSERHVEDDRQMSLFDQYGDELPEFDDPSDDEKKSAVKGHTRRAKRSQGFPDDLKRRTVMIKVPEEKRGCHCGLEKIFVKYEVTRKLHKVPAVYELIEELREVLACPKKCRGEMVTAPKRPTILPRMRVTESFLADLITSKVIDRQPHYHIESQLKSRFGLDFTRQRMSRLFIDSAKPLQPLVNLLKDEIVGYDIASLDATTLLVLKEPQKAMFTVLKEENQAENRQCMNITLFSINYLSETGSLSLSDGFIVIAIHGLNCFFLRMRSFRLRAPSCQDCCRILTTMIGDRNGEKILARV